MTLDERLEALTHSLELFADMQMQAAERHDREIAEIRERQEKFQASQAKLEASQEKFEANQEKLQASQEKTERTLRRAIRLSVLDARRQRERNREFEEGTKEFRAALQVFLERGGNGKH